MKTEQQRIGTVDVFIPDSPLVDQEGEKFCNMLLDRIKNGNSRVVLDMHQVAYVDSVALENLLTATERFQERASSLKIASAMPTCREIFEVTGLSNQFRFFKDVQDAVKSFL